jgi:ferrochelatase
LETLEEIKDEAREAFMHAGGEAFNYIECLNDDAKWIEGLGLIAAEHLQGWPTRALSATQAAELDAASHATNTAALTMGAKQ